MNKNILLSTSALLFTLNLLAIFPKRPKKPVGPLTNINYNNALYKNKNTFIYKVAHIGRNLSFLNIDTLGVCCFATISELNNQHMFSWRPFQFRGNSFEYKLQNFSEDCTGVIVSDTCFFIHPPRKEKYKILEFCPMPDFKKKTIGATWHWDFVVGSLWAIPKLYPITSTDTFHIDYTLVDSTTIHLQDSIKLNNYFSPNAVMMSNRSYFCYHISAVSVSRFGKAYGDYYYNNEIGLIYFKLTPVDGSSYEFTFLALIK